MRLLGQEMTTGTTVSAVGHAGFIVWLLTGWGLTHEPIPFEVTEVSVVSGEEYARLVAATTPQPQTEIGQAPEAPVIEDRPPPPETPPEDTPPPPPEPPEPPPEAPPPDQPPPPAPEPPPPAEVTEEVTTLVAPEPSAPPPTPDLEVSLRPVPRAADRVAPEAIEAPPEDVPVAPEVTEEATPEAETAEVVPEEAEAAAPEETTTEIVTEADEPSSAPETSLRPASRPTRPATPPPAPETDVAEAAPAETPAEAPADTAAAAVEDDIAAALAAAAAETAGAPAANPGPPMTGAERDAFRLAVSGCWSVDIGSEAARVQLVVAFELDRDGRVVGNVVDLVSATDGSAAAIEAAYQAARRAIIRCQSTEGYNLPEEKYESWRQVRMTFDPSGMRMQ